MILFSSPFMPFTFASCVFIVVLRIRRISPLYRPFMLLVLLSFYLECAAIYFEGKVEEWINLLFPLLQCQLVLFQFKMWGLYKDSLWMYYLLAVALALGFGASVYFEPRGRWEFSFPIAANALFLLQSVALITEVIFFESYQLWRNARFWLCIAFIAYGGYTIVLQVLFSFAPGLTENWLWGHIDMFNRINYAIQLPILIAVICMPTKKRPLRPSIAL